MLLTPALGRQRLVISEFKACLVYVSLHSKVFLFLTPQFYVGPSWTNGPLYLLLPELISPETQAASVLGISFLSKPTLPDSRTPYSQTSVPAQEGARFVSRGQKSQWEDLPFRIHKPTIHRKTGRAERHANQALREPNIEPSSPHRAQRRGLQDPSLNTEGRMGKETRKTERLPVVDF